MKAKEEIIMRNLGLVHSVCRKQFPSTPNLEYEDIFNNGVLGLIRAVEKFDWRLGNTFSTYAINWISQNMRRQTQRTAKSVRMPVHLEARIRKIELTAEKLTGLLGRYPSNQEISSAAELPLEEVVELKRFVSYYGNAENYEIDIAEGFYECPESCAIEQSEYAQVREILEELGDDSGKIVNLYFGDEKPMHIVGKEIGCTRGGVSYKIDKIKEHVKEEFELAA